MGAKLAAFFVTLFINFAAGVAIFLFMLMTMNGFSESDASYGLGAYIVLAGLVSLIMSAGAAATVHVLMKRKFRSGTSALIAIPIFSITGAMLKMICSIIGVLIAEHVRVNY